MQQSCSKCSAQFEVTPDELAFYAKLDVPPPMLCPACRRQRREAFRCERTFHHRTCTKCSKDMISMYSSELEAPVYCLECYWGDSWDPMDHQQEYNPAQSFFAQFALLQELVPRIGIIGIQNENSDYSNYGSRMKNCYMLIAGDQSEDCLYGSYVWLSRDCIDCLCVKECEQCYDCTNCEHCYHCLWSQLLENCTDCRLCFDCRSCSDCFACTGLRGKQYCFFNEQLSKQDYMQRLDEMQWTHGELARLQEQMQPLLQQLPRKFAQILNCQDCTGDGLIDCKNALDCYDSFGLEDCRYIINGPESIKDCYDHSGVTGCELCYEGVSSHALKNCIACHHCWQGGSNLQYCAFCMGCNDCFGCIGLRKKQYCILNKQYTKEEYETLKLKIIQKMKADGEYGEFFSLETSPFVYEDTLAQEEFPHDLVSPRRARSDCASSSSDNKVMPSSPRQDMQIQEGIPASRLPDAIEDIPDDILDWPIVCRASGRSYKIIKQELTFYRENKIPVPHLHPDERHALRRKVRNPYQLWNRTCDECGAAISSSYDPSRNERVLCEECYFKEVY